MGWNQIWKKKDEGLYTDIKDGEFFYFVHSFYVVPEEENITASTTDYITDFCSAIQKDNIWAVQYHPEKSQTAGLKLLENFKRFVERS
jgi:glutamine amidotransferase